MWREGCWEGEFNFRHVSQIGVSDGVFIMESRKNNGAKITGKVPKKESYPQKIHRRRPPNTPNDRIITKVYHTC